MEIEPFAFTNWLNDFFTAYYHRRPVNATFVGMHELDHQLPDYSEGGAADTINEMQSLLARLQTLPEEPLRPAQMLDRKLAEGYLRTQLWEFESDHFQRGNPCQYTGEAVFSVISLFLTDYAPIEERVAAAVDRINAIPGFLAQGMTNLQQAPEMWIRQSLDECTGALAFFNQGIDRITSDYSIHNLAFKSASVKASDAFEQFQGFLQQNLLPHATQNYASGQEAFELMLHSGHFVHLDLDEYVRYAESQIDEAEAYLSEHAADFGAGSSAEALAKLADIHPTLDEYYQRFNLIWQACCELAQQKQLITWPDFPIEYIPQPLWARDAAPHLYFLPYRSPAVYLRPAVHRYLVPTLHTGMTERSICSCFSSVIPV